MGTPLIKTSTIFIAKGRRTRVYRSMDEVPAPLRDKISADMSGPNSRTLIVADRRGREYLLRASKRIARDIPKAQAKAVSSLEERYAKAKLYWLEIGLIGLLGAASWILFRWN